MDEFSRVIHQIYEAAMAPERWNGVVAMLAASFGATKALLLTPFLGPQHGGLLFPFSITEAELQIWATRYIAHDIWSQRTLELGLWTEGTVAVDTDLVSTEELHRSIFYREYLSRIGIEWWCGGIVFEQAAGLPRTSLSFFRGKDDAPFNEADKAWLRLLIPHLSRAMGMMYRLKAVELKSESMRFSLERVSFGVALLNENRQVLHMNGVAAEIVGRNDGMLLSPDGRLDARSTAGRSRLQPWLEASTKNVPTATGHFSDGFVVPRDAIGAKYLIQYAVVMDSNHWVCREEHVRYVVFLTDPDATRLPRTDYLIQLYGLTKTEAAVTLHLANGRTPLEISKSSNCALATVRAHIRNIFKKTRINRHADLIRLVLSLSEVSA